MSVSAGKVRKLRQMVLNGALDADPSFMDGGPELIAANLNGCGAANAKFDFVPDRCYGLYIGDACHIHDWDYFIGKTNEDKNRGDRRLQNNYMRLIRRDKFWLRRLLKPAMRARAKGYYLAVKHFGGEAFWQGKNEYS